MAGVSIKVGSDSDMPILKESGALEVLEAIGIPYRISILSAHRHPEALAEYNEMYSGDFDVIIDAASMAAALPGSDAGLTGGLTPVLGVALPSTGFEDGHDAMLAISRMPPGRPVGFCGVGKAGLKNAAIHAAQILAVGDSATRVKLEEFQRVEALKKRPQPDYVIFDTLVFEKHPLGRMSLIAEGKTKAIYRPERFEGHVIKHNKGIITAGDGRRRSRVPQKGEYSTDTTVNCFNLLEARGIKTDLNKRIDHSRILCDELEMIPVECVARRVIGAKSSYRKRNPGLEDGDIVLNEVVVEFFYKDDTRHDPIIIEQADGFSIHDPGVPIGHKLLGKLPDVKGKYRGSTDELFAELKELTLEAFVILEDAFLSQQATLEDYKVEFGLNTKGEIILGDVLDPDSWRLKYYGDALDKQDFRDAENVTPELIRAMGEKYRIASLVTSRFQY